MVTADWRWRLIGLLVPISLAAQTDRVVLAIDSGDTVTLAGHVRKLPRSYVDEGAVEDSQRMEGLILFLKPSDAQKVSLDRLLIDLHDPSSMHYHHWLTPEQYADQFGVSASDAEKIAVWLQSQGFSVDQIGRARSFIVFDGTARTVDGTFHTTIHRYRSGTAVHYANAADPLERAVYTQGNSKPCRCPMVRLSRGCSR